MKKKKNVKKKYSNKHVVANDSDKYLINLMKVNIIVAYDLDGNIGKRGMLPWLPVKEDMRYFARNTSAGLRPAVIMGRKTWESIPERHRPLKNRMNVIVSSTMNDIDHDGCYVVKSIQEGTSLASRLNVDTLWVIGGASMYKSFLVGGVDKVYVTVMKDRYEDCDTKFPVECLGKEFIVDHEYDFYDECGNNPFSFKTYIRQQ